VLVHVRIVSFVSFNTFIKSNTNLDHSIMSSDPAMTAYGSLDPINKKHLIYLNLHNEYNLNSLLRHGLFC
jgi:hypothetical protein